MLREGMKLHLIKCLPTNGFRAQTYQISDPVEVRDFPSFIKPLVSYDSGFFLNSFSIFIQEREIATKRAKTDQET